MLKYLENRAIFETLVRDLIPQTKQSLWIATADIKDMYTQKGKEYVPFLEVLSDLSEKGVALRLLYAKEPGPNFRDDFDRFPNLINGMEQILCPRVHLKMTIIDQEILYMGSANLTGAGMGPKSVTKRNFESAILTDEIALVERAIEQFDAIWRGDHCRPCSRKEYCTDYKTILGYLS